MCLKIRIKSRGCTTHFLQGQDYWRSWRIMAFEDITLQFYRENFSNKNCVLFSHLSIPSFDHEIICNSIVNRGVIYLYNQEPILWKSNETICFKYRNWDSTLYVANECKPYKVKLYVNIPPYTDNCFEYLYLDLTKHSSTCHDIIFYIKNVSNQHSYFQENECLVTLLPIIWILGYQKCLHRSRLFEMT